MAIQASAAKAALLAVILAALPSLQVGGAMVSIKRDYADDIALNYPSQAFGTRDTEVVPDHGGNDRLTPDGDGAAHRIGGIAS